MSEERWLVVKRAAAENGNGFQKEKHGWVVRAQTAVSGWKKIGYGRDTYGACSHFLPTRLPCGPPPEIAFICPILCSALCVP